MTPTTRQELVGSFGMVAASDWLAAGAGVSMLEQGGNAFDAAVATGLVLQVVEPHLNGPGGEVPIILYDAASEEVVVVDGQGPAPMAATLEGMRAQGVDLIPGTGLLPANVPGAFGAWMLLLQRYGRLSLRQVMEPVLHYAEHGVPVLPGVSLAIAGCRERFSTLWPTSGEVYLPGGAAPAPGTLLRNPGLARTYEAVLAAAEGAGPGRERQVEGARHFFYEGGVAEVLDQFLQRAEPWDETGTPHRAFLRGEDLARWRASLEAPAAVDYAGVRVHKTGPWGQGPVFLQQLRLLAGFDLGSLATDSAEFVHLVIECAKLAFADREAWYGDPRQLDVPMAELLSPAYSDQRRRLVGEGASAEVRPGSPGGRRPRLPSPGLLARAAAAGAATGLPADPVGRDTCHLDAADRWGNLVSATPSGGWLQGSPVVPGLGFPLSTRAQMFWLEEGLAGSLAPGRRPRTTLTPTLVLRDDRPWLACGTPGGDQQDQWTLVFFLRHLHHRLDLQAALEAPAFHSAHFQSSFYPRAAGLGQLHLERRFAPEVVAELERRGHALRPHPPWSLGRVCAVEIAADGQLHAAADPRQGQAYAAGR